MENTIAAQLLLSLPTGPVASTCGQLHKDADYEYSNLAGLGHLDNIVSSQDCCTLCQGEPTCKSFTWVRDAHLLIGNPGQCWLKGGRFIQRSVKSGVYSAFVRDDKVEKMFSQDPDTKPESADDDDAEDKPTTTAETSEDTTEAASEAATQDTSTQPWTSTETTTVTTTTTADRESCCAYEPFVGCGHALNISHICDDSKKKCETQCAGKWLEQGASEKTEGMNVNPPTKAPKPTMPPPRSDDNACCSFEPLKACGDELAISKYCDMSKKRCEDDCAGKWLPGGPKDNPTGLDLYSEYLPSSDAA